MRPLIGTEMQAVPQPAPDAEIELVRRARKHQRQAWNEIYERHHKAVHACLLARVPAKDAEDILQDVFVVAMRRIDSLRDEERLGGWLMTIARNRATDFWRRHKATEVIDEQLEDEAKRGPEVAEALRAIRKLPDTYRETLIMRLVEGMTGPEIAERTGMTHGSVRVNLTRGMKLLREALKVEVAQ
jgi:RNA polymerase sigma-70 factor (ECF subfamily)